MVSLFQNMINLVSCRKICAPRHVQFQLSVGVTNVWLDSNSIQSVINNTINSQDYINLLLTKTIIKRSKMLLMQQKCHLRYYVNFLISKYISFNQQIHVHNWWIKNVIDGFSRFLNKYISNNSNLSSPKQSKLIISKKRWQHVFWSGSWIIYFNFFCFFSYVPGLYFVSSCMW